MLDDATLNDLAAYYKMSPDELRASLAQMAEAGVFDERMAAMQPQMEIAQAGLSQKMPQGQMVSGFYVPPSPMASLGGLAGKMLGGYAMAEGMGQQKGLIDALRGGQEAAGVIGMKDRDAERNLIAELLRRMQSPPEPALKDPYGALDGSDPMAGIPPLLRRPQG